MRAILVSVDYADLLARTLPYNRHHFDEVTVVTTPWDYSTATVAADNGARIITTEAFYADGAAFNKWAALEYGLSQIGRSGWLCIMDADILWPRVLPDFDRQIDYLYTPRRRMFVDTTKPIPAEFDWHLFPIHRNEREWAGYSQIFHSGDIHLPPNPPWHQTDWRHAGGADSFFQALWPETHKVRPPFECLHLGAAGENWCGRATPYLDGSRHPLADERLQQLRAFIRGRRLGPDRFAGEKLPPTPVFGGKATRSGPAVGESMPGS